MIMACEKSARSGDVAPARSSYRETKTKMRVKPIDLDELVELEELDRQGAELCKAISGPRGGIVDGPFRVWLRANPELAARMNDVGNVLRKTGKLDKKLVEIAILCVARFWDAPYQWAAHGPIAHKVGLSQKTIDAIGRGERPKSAPEDQQAVYDLTMSLLEQRRIPDDLYEHVLTLIEFDEMSELITTIGQYSLAAIVTNGFDILLPSGGPDLPERTVDDRDALK